MYCYGNRNVPVEHFLRSTDHMMIKIINNTINTNPATEMAMVPAKGSPVWIKGVTLTAFEAAHDAAAGDSWVTPNSVDPAVVFPNLTIRNTPEPA